jgi:hypothetical protein
MWLAILVAPLLMAASCENFLTVTLTGCPDGQDVAAGTSYTITAALEDPGGNDVTADATFTYAVTQGPQSITITGQGNSRTINIPVGATTGATVIDVTASLPDQGSGSAECRFTIVEPECAEDSDCDDGDACTEDACAGGVCGNPPVDCDDGLACTTDTCDSSTGCVNAGTCPAATPFCTMAGCAECRTDNDCEAGSCEDGLCAGDGCENDADCSDGLFCNGVEACAGGLCVPGVDPCTIECADVACSEGDGQAVCSCVYDFTFTAGSDDFTGGEADELFHAPADEGTTGSAPAATLQTGDRADGRGGVDRLDATFAAREATTVEPDLRAIEILNITDRGPATTTLDASAINGVTEINAAGGTRELSVIDLRTAPAVGLFNTAAGARLGFVRAATSGHNDVLTLNLRGTAGGEVVILPGQNANSFESVEFASLTPDDGGDDPNVIDRLMQFGNTLRRVNIRGAQPIVLTAVDPLVVMVDGSGMTGGGFRLGSGDGSAASPYIGFSGADNSAVEQVIGGPGPDQIIFGETLDADDLGDAGAIIELAGGVDLLQASLHSALVAPLPLQNVEQLALSATADVQVDLAGVAGVTDVFVTADGESNVLTLLSIAAKDGRLPALRFRGDGLARDQNYDSVAYEGDPAATGVSLSIQIDNRGQALGDGAGGPHVHRIGSILIQRAKNLDIVVEDGSAEIAAGMSVWGLEHVSCSSSGHLDIRDVSTGPDDTLGSVTAEAVVGGFAAALNGLASGAIITTGPGHDALDIGDSAATVSSVTLADGDDVYVSADLDCRDTIDAGPGRDIVAAGGGENTVNTGAGADDVIFDHPGPGSLTDIVDFTAGPGAEADRMVFDEGDLGLGTGSIFVGAVGAVGAADVLIITGSTYATDAAAAAAVAGVSAVAAPGAVVYFNATDSTTHIIYVTNLSTGAGDTHIGTLSNLTAPGQHNALTTANVATQP